MAHRDRRENLPTRHALKTAKEDSVKRMQSRQRGMKQLRMYVPNHNNNLDWYCQNAALNDDGKLETACVGGDWELVFVEMVKREKIYIRTGGKIEMLTGEAEEKQTGGRERERTNTGAINTAKVRTSVAA